MECPHCLVNIHFPEAYQASFGADADSEEFNVGVIDCPACKKKIIRTRQLLKAGRTPVVRIVYPPVGLRRPAPAEVPATIAGDYTEAGNVLPISPKASAALSRRCLQNILRHQKGGNVQRHDLNQEIDAVLPSLPPEIAGGVDAIRVVGNYAAHPSKSQQTGEIVDVEPNEAEWNLEVIESLMDHYFVRPAQLAAKRDALNAKLATMGKPPLK